MAAQLPSLKEDGAVAFGTAEDFEAGWTTYIARGAISVRPERELRPLEQLEVFLRAPGLTSRIAMQVEVVHLDPARALLRLLDPVPPKPELAPLMDLQDLAPAAPPPEIVVDAAPPALAVQPPQPEIVVERAAPELVVGAPVVEDLPVVAGLPRIETRPPVAAGAAGAAGAAVDVVDDLPVVQGLPRVGTRPPEPAPAIAPLATPPYLVDERFVPPAARTQDLDITRLMPDPSAPLPRPSAVASTSWSDAIAPGGDPLAALHPPIGAAAGPDLEPMERSDEHPLLEPAKPPPTPSWLAAPEPAASAAVAAAAAAPAPDAAAAASSVTPASSSGVASPAPITALTARAVPPPPVTSSPPAPPPGGAPPRTPTPAAMPATAAAATAMPRAPTASGTGVGTASSATSATTQRELVMSSSDTASSKSVPPPSEISWSAAIEVAVVPPPVAKLPTPAPAVPAAEGTPPPPPPAGAVAVTSLPPYFTGDALKFTSSDDLRGAREHLTTVGAILAICDGKVPLSTIEVKLAVGNKETRGRAKVTLAAAAPGTAVVQAVEKGAFKALLDELERELPGHRAAQSSNVFPAIVDPAQPTHQTPPSMPGVGMPRQFSLPRQGTVANPTTPEAILDLPLARPPTDAELSKPSVPLLLRWLRTTRGTLRLEVTAQDHPVFTAIFVDGREVRTPASLATLGKSLALPSMTYNIVDLGRPPQMTTTGRTMHLIAETVRALCAQCSADDLARAFPQKPGMCARAVPDVVAGLGLPAQHQRFIKTDVDGSQFIDEIGRAAVGARTVWETMYLLEVYNGIAWDRPPPGKKPSARTTTKSFERPSALTEEDSFAPFEGKDHFQVLGLHWSSSPTEVAPAYQKLRSEYGPSGIKRPSSTPAAEKILKRLEEAFKVLNNGDTRRAYRREKYNLVWAHQAQLLVQKAKLALYRKDFQETLNILLAAEDMHPSEEAKALLAALKQKQKQKGDESE